VPQGHVTVRGTDREATIRSRFPIESYRKSRFSAGIHCPRCRSSHVLHWGRYSGRRRYRCRSCGRTFSDFTGSPLAYLKKLDQWIAHCSSALDRDTVRSEAQRLGVHRNTVFRWRHRLLRALENADGSLLAGVVAVRETTFPHSEKGSRHLTRPARRKGWSMGGPSLRAPSVWVTVAYAGDGHVASGVIPARRPTVLDYARVLSERLAPGTRLTSRGGPTGALALFAARSRHTHEGAIHHEPEYAAASTYVLRLRSWMRRFHGVATKYLSNYLIWHRFLHALGSGRASGVRHLLMVTFP
jgi:transposase-like protein